MTLFRIKSALVLGTERQRVFFAWWPTRVTILPRSTQPWEDEHAEVRWLEWLSVLEVVEHKQFIDGYTTYTLTNQFCWQHKHLLNSAMCRADL
jgi:hypothetical protein